MSSIENIVLSLKKHSAVAKNSANPAPAAQSWVGERSADHINLVRAGRANPASPKANLEESTSRTHQSDGPRHKMGGKEHPIVRKTYVSTATSELD